MSQYSATIQPVYAEVVYTGNSHYSLIHFKSRPCQFVGPTDLFFRIYLKCVLWSRGLWGRMRARHERRALGLYFTTSCAYFKRSGGGTYPHFFYFQQPALLMATGCLLRPKVARAVKAQTMQQKQRCSFVNIHLGNGQKMTPLPSLPPFFQCFSWKNLKRIFNGTMTGSIDKNNICLSIH